MVRARYRLMGSDREEGRGEYGVRLPVNALAGRLALSATILICHRSGCTHSYHLITVGMLPCMLPCVLGLEAR